MFEFKIPIIFTKYAHYEFKVMYIPLWIRVVDPKETTGGPR
jgi:hypothetical protein